MKSNPLESACPEPGPELGTRGDHNGSDVPPVTHSLGWEKTDLQVIIVAHGQHHDKESPRDPYSQQRLPGEPFTKLSWKDEGTVVSKGGKDAEGPCGGRERSRGRWVSVAACGDGSLAKYGAWIVEPLHSLRSFGRKPTWACFSQEGHLQEGDGCK